MSMPGPLELGLIFLVILFIVGPKKIPDIARSLGKGIREFKKSLTDLPSENIENKASSSSESPKKPEKKEETETIDS